MNKEEVQKIKTNLRIIPSYEKPFLEKIMDSYGLRVFLAKRPDSCCESYIRDTVGQISEKEHFYKESGDKLL